MNNQTFSVHDTENLENKSIQVTLSYNDYKNFLKKFDEMGSELNKFREDLLAHQNKVRKIILDSNKDIS